MQSDDLDRAPPQNEDFERAVLGAMLFDPMAIKKAAERLDQTCFYKPRHKKIFRAIVSLFEAGERIDPKIVVEELRARKEYDDEAPLYIARLESDVTTVANIERDVRKLVEYAKRRKAMIVGQKLLSTAGRIDVDIDELLKFGVDELAALWQKGAESEERDIGFKNILDIGSLVDTQYDKPQALLQREEDPPLLATHQVLMIGGAHGVGKTVSCLNIALCLAGKLHAFGLWQPAEATRVLYVHAEAEHPYYVQEQVNMMLSDQDRVSQEQKQRIRENVQLCLGPELLNGEMLDLRNRQHQNILSKAALDFGAGLVILDPLYWVSGGVDFNKSQDMEGIGKSLRAIAELSNGSVLGTSHLNRAGDIAGSYAIKAFASSIIILHSLEMLGQFRRGDLGLYLDKCRNGWPRDGKNRWHVVLNRDSLWFDSTALSIPVRDELLSERRGRRSEYRIEDVIEILDVEGKLSYEDLKKAVIEKLGCSEATAKRLITKAVKSDLVKRDHGKYCPVTLF